MHEIEGLARFVPEGITPEEVDLREILAVPARNLEGRFVSIDRIDSRRDAAGACPAHHFPRDISASRAKIEHAITPVGIPPAREESPNHAVAPGRAIHRLERGEMPLEFG